MKPILLLTLTLGLASSTSAQLIDQPFNQVPPTSGTPSSGYTVSGFSSGPNLSYTNGASLVTSGGSLEDASGSNPGSLVLTPTGLTIVNDTDYWGSFLLNLSSPYTATRTSGFSIASGPDRMVISFNTPTGSSTTNGTINFGVRDGAGDPADGFRTTGGEVELSLNTTELYVFKVEVDATGSNSNLYVWRNPFLDGHELSTGAADWSYVATTTPGGGSFANSTNFGEWSFDSSNQAQIIFDELRFGTDFNQVVPIPEPTTAALVLGSLSLLAWRRRS